MDSQDLMGRVRTLRARGYSPKQIARALGVSPATVTPLVRTIAAADQASAAQRQLAGCWVSPGWSQGLTVDGHPEWPDDDAADAGAQGLVSVLVTRQERYGRVGVCGWLVDVWCLGVKDVVGPRAMNERRVAEFTRSYFAAYQAPPLQAPVELARHLVFGAVAYAQSLGFEPAPGFQATAEHLGPWAGPSASASGATASLSSSRAPTTTPQPSSPRWSAPSGGTTSTSWPAHSCGG
jgi:transcriptional regulator with XRE-family HTH domain